MAKHSANYSASKPTFSKTSLANHQPQDWRESIQEKRCSEEKQSCKKRQIWQIYLCCSLMIIVSLLSLINMTKFLFLVVLQNMSLLRYYLNPKSICNATGNVQNLCSIQWAMYMGRNVSTTKTMHGSIWVQRALWNSPKQICQVAV